jgi:hypothetical protein
MANNTIWGILGLNDRLVSVSNVGQAQIYDAVNRLAATHSAEIAAASAALIQATTTRYTEYYALPGGGKMQESDRLTRPGAIKPPPSFPVSYDLRDARDQLAWDDISIAYMNLEEVQNAVQTVFIRHMNWVRWQVLKHVFNNTNETFSDETVGADLTIRRLANADGTEYGPLFGDDTLVGGTHDHYLVSGYAASAISATNDPYKTLRDEIEEHWGPGNIVTFINPTEAPETEALADFVPVEDSRLIQPVTAEAIVPGSLPSSVPGTIIGRIDRQWVSEWRAVPSNYMLSIDLDQPAPLKKRIDTPSSISGRGDLALVARQTEFPLEESFWRDRHGYGVGNRLNGAVMFLDAGAVYDIPTEFA